MNRGTERLKWLSNVAAVQNGEKYKRKAALLERLEIVMIKIEIIIINSTVISVGIF